jgi:hypothetical protein
MFPTLLGVEDDLPGWFFRICASSPSGNRFWSTILKSGMRFSEKIMLKKD